MAFFGRALAGAVGGGVVGGIATGSLGGVGYGAAFGAGTAGLGPTVGRRAMAGRGTIAGTMTGALGGIGDIAMRGASRIGNKGLFNVARGMDRGLTRAATFIGQNSVSVNKYGGTALLGMGTAASAYIGSTALASNKPFGLNR